MGTWLGNGALGKGAAGVGVTLAGRDATSSEVVGIPVKVEVPPGRYWPAGAAIRTVDEATVAGLYDGVLDCGAVVALVGMAGGANGTVNAFGEATLVAGTRQAQWSM